MTPVIGLDPNFPNHIKVEAGINLSRMPFLAPHPHCQISLSTNSLELLRLLLRPEQSEEIHKAIVQASYLPVSPYATSSRPIFPREAAVQPHCLPAEKSPHICASHFLHLSNGMI